MADTVKTVGFLKGLQANLPTTNAVAGSFYLTTDTNRLYVGGDDNTLRELNRYIHIVNTQAALANPTAFKPAEGDFAFVKEGNILVVYMTHTDSDGVTRTGWVQVNPNTDTNDNIDSLVNGVSGTATAAAGSQLNIGLVISQIEKDLIAGSSKNLSDVSGTITITKQNLIDVLNLSVATAVTETETENYAVTTLKSGENELGKVKVVAGKNVSISAVDDGYEISVKAEEIKTDYDLLNNGTKIALMLDGSEAAGSVELKAGTDLEVSSADGSITYNHKEYSASSKSVTNDATLKNDGSGKLNIISGITLSNGHVTEINVAELNLPEDSAVTAVGVDNKGQIALTLNSNETIKSEASLYYTIGDHSDKYYNQAALPIYTKSEIDEMVAKELADINAMVFRGAVPNTGLPTSDVRIGDTYILNDNDITVNGMEVGDLAIATGTEDANGYITGDIEWIIVPSADEVIITYDVKVDNNSIRLVGSDDTAKTVKFIAGNDDIIIESSSADNELKFSHKTYSDSLTGLEDQGTLNHGDTFTIIKNVAIENGHVTGIETEELTLPSLPEDNDTKYNLANSGNTIKLMQDVSQEVGSITINGVDENPVTVSASHANDDSTFTIEHVKATIDNAAAASDTLSHGGNFTVYDVNADEYGHVIARKAHQYTLPTESTYTLSLTDDGVDGNTGYKVELFKDGSESRGSYIVNSSSLQITASANNASIDVVWGSF